MSLTEKQQKRRREVIEDIIQKRPTSNGCTYTSEKYYDYDRNYERTKMIPSKSFFGYDPAELVSLELHNSGYQLRESMYEIYEKGHTQKMNRFDERICSALLKHIRNVGVPGLYRVRTSLSNLGFIYANNLSEAQRVADVTYGFTIAGKKNRWGDQVELAVGFHRCGTVAELNASNESDVARLNEKIRDAKESVERILGQISDHEQDLIAIQMSELSQLSASFEEDAA
jgi:hypothetical protein